MNHIFEEIAAERKRQGEKSALDVPMWFNAIEASACLSKATKYKKKLTPFELLLQGIYKILLETDSVKQREELIQTAAVIVQIIEYLDRQILGLEREQKRKEEL